MASNQTVTKNPGTVCSGVCAAPGQTVSQETGLVLCKILKKYEAMGIFPIDFDEVLYYNYTIE